MQLFGNLLHPFLNALVGQLRLAVFIDGEADAVLAASVFHFGTYTVREVKEYMASQGIPVRLDF